MRDYAELVKALRHCIITIPCDGCPYYSKGDAPTKECSAMNFAAADAIEELLAFAYAVAKMAVNAEEDEVSAEVLCRKLYKLGIIEKDGAWWWLPEPPKEDAK